MKWKALSVLILTAAGGGAQQTDSASQAIQQRLTAIKASIAQNEAKLKRYHWTESTQISVKGKVKRIEQNECRYGPDGQLVKTPIGAGPADTKLDNELDRIRSLIRRYVPPDPVAIQDAFQAGKVAINTASGVLTFNDYAKPGDMLTLAFDPGSRNIRSYDVTSFLDEPSDRVTLNAQFSKLPDGTNFLEEYEFDARGKEIHMKTANFGHSE
jgi:hypothetical protein